jgi:ribosomal protein S12 methylthiotransferase
VGCFKYSPVEGAVANDLAEPVPEDVKEERFARFMELQEEISAERLQRKVGKRMLVIVDEVTEEGSVARTMGDAPDIDGLVFIDNVTNVQPGDILDVVIEEADEHDMWAHLAE